MIWPWIAGAAVLAAIVLAVWRIRRNQDAYIYVPEGFPVAQFRYQDLPMKECAWCHHTVNLNRHHIEPWAANPEKKDDVNNLVVLCRPCHCSVAHGNNWKRYNANLMETLKTQKWVDSNHRYRETHGGKDRTEVRK